MNFNLRVYALIIDNANRLLLSDEYRFGEFFTKFPGGGIEPGEGILEALHREIIEELNLEIDHAVPFYYNDFFQKSAFHQKQQIVSFYYIIKCNTSKIVTLPYSIPFEDETEKQRWVNLSAINENDLTFPIDKVVLNKLKKEFLTS
jgi:8-oxo-dGTP diphosphatase